MSQKPAIITTGTRGSRLVGGAALVALGALLLFGLILSPDDIVQRESVRLMYVHVPSGWLAYLSFFVTAACSVLYLVPRTRSLTWDRVAACSAELGVLFTGLALVTGSIWGNLTWGVFWTWDARLTSTALLFLLFVGYLALRRLPAAPDVRAKRAAIAGIVAFLDVPIVHFSVEWWRGQHQGPTVLRPDLDPQIDGAMLFTLFVGVVAFTLVYVWLMLHRNRVAMMEAILEDQGLEQAIAERHAEGAHR
jgi:heme exporter protein C